MFYSRLNFNNGDKWDAGKIGGVYRFRHKEFEQIRQTVIAAELYQAIKRINRNNDRVADVYIINNDQEILEKLIEQFNGIKVEEYSLNIEYEISEKKVAYDKEREENSYYNNFIEFVSTLDKGVYQKKWIREQIGFSNQKTFSKLVLNKEKVIQFMAAANIEAKGQSIIVS